MNFKNNIFWIVIVVIVLVSIGVWAVMVPPLQAEAKQNKDGCVAKVKAFEELANAAAKEDKLKTPKHVEAANKYKQRIQEQLDALQKDLQSKKFVLRFDNADVESSKFDIWLSKLREKLTAQATQAGLQLPADADKLMFKEPATDENAADVTRHRGYRLRQMAIVEEVINTLCKKWGKQQVLKFEPDKSLTEPQEQVEVGPLALDRISIASPANLTGAKAATSSRAGGAAAAASSMSTSEDRMKIWMEDAFKRSGSKLTAAVKGPPYQQLPYSITSVDVQFVAPLVTITPVIQALETSDRWSAVVTRVDYQRSVMPFPLPTEPKIVKAGPVSGLNTHFQEGPVRVLVSLDLYEYDEAKAKAAAAAANEPKPATKKK